MVDWGLVVRATTDAAALHDYVPELERVLPPLRPYVKSLWMTDHFFWGLKPTYEAWTVISYLAAHFPEYQVAPIVLGQSYRNPALLAKMGATLHTLSGGRLIMGIGAGWKDDEYHAYGYEYPSAGVRLEQLEDTLEILKRMWTEPGKVSYQGKHYHITDAICEPKPDPIPTMVVGGAGDKTIGLAAKYADWWNMPDANYEKFADRVRVVRENCERIGRDPASLRITWFGRVVVGRTDAEVVARQGEWTKDRAFNGTPAEVVDGLNRFVELGCDHFMIQIVDMGNPDVVDLVAREVLPHVG